jgi:hypothetical protein
MKVQKAGRREIKVADRGYGVARNFGALAGLASSAVFLNGWPHEALGDELGCSFNAGVAEGMQGVKYLLAKRRWYVRARFS